MKRFFFIILLIVTVGCSSKPLSTEDTIYQYYEYLIEGDMDKATEMLDWDPNQGDVIEYFADLNKLQSLYNLTSFEGLEIVSIIDSAGSSNAVINLIYLDDTNQYRVETNKIVLNLNEEQIWKIISITREISE